MNHHLWSWAVAVGGGMALAELERSGQVPPFLPWLAVWVGCLYLAGRGWRLCWWLYYRTRRRWRARR